MSSSGLQRILGFKETLALVIGSVIGSGIFMKPSIMAAQLQSPWILISVWLVAGIITMCGALSNAEAACMYPETGGQYVFFEKMYGKAFSYIYGWASFSVFNTAGNASIAYVCSQYLNFLIKFPELEPALIQQYKIHIPAIGNIILLEHFYLKLLTILVLIIISWINIRSTKESVRIQNILSAFKIIAILIIVLGAFISRSGELSHFSESSILSKFHLTTFMMALTGAFWAFDGWNNLSFVGGEIKDPQKNIPRSLILGIAICTITYILVNVAFIYLLGIKNMSSSEFIATDASIKIFGGAGAIIITLIIVLSTLGTVNSNVLSTARVTLALGTNNRIFSGANKIHPRFRTPYTAINYNLVWSILLILSGSFDMLTDMLIFITWFFYGMSALGVIILRYRLPEVVRTYKVWLYPLPNIIFILFSFSYLVITLYNDISNYMNGQSEIIQSVFGLSICILGLPLYYIGRSNCFLKKNNTP